MGAIRGVFTDPANNIYILDNSEIRIIQAGQPNIQNFAGSQASGFAGDGSGVASAIFAFTSGMAFDSAGNVYVSDSVNNRIRKIAGGIVTTFAGNGKFSSQLTGAVATSVPLSPVSILVDAANSVYFTDLGGNSALGIQPITKTLSYVFEDGTFGTASGGVLIGQRSLIAGSHQDFYYLDGNSIVKVSGGVFSTIGNVSGVSGFSGDGGPATAAQFSLPQALAISSNGDVYVADYSNYRIRMINGQTGIVTTIAGVGFPGVSTVNGGLATNTNLNFPISLALDGNGNLFFADRTSNHIRKIVLKTNIITTVAGDGSTAFADGVLATATGIDQPNSVFADQSGNLFISDLGHSRIRKVSASTGIITTIAGNGVSDFSGDGGLATSAAITPYALTLDRAGMLDFVDGSGRIRTFPVTACFFAISMPTVNVGSGSSTRSVTVTATNSSCPYNVSSSLPFVTITSGASGTGSGTVNFSVAAATGSNRTATVNIGGATFAVTQAGSAMPYNVGYFQPSGPTWALDSNGSGGYDAGDRVFAFAGQPGAIAVTGDWNGDGKTKVGYYLNGFWALDYNGNGVYDGTGPGGDKFYAFGGASASYVPVVGDWSGDGRTKIGFYYNGFWALDTNGNGTFDGTGVGQDSFYGFGGNGPGEVPLLGDWNGDARTKVGYFFNGTWVLDYDGNGSFTAADKYYNTFPYVSGDKPVTGDWTGDGKTKIGIFRGGFWILDNNNNGTYDGIGAGQDKFYGFGGNAGEIPLVADWNGSGTSKIGFYLNGFWVLDYNGNGSYDGTGPGGDRFIAFGGPSGYQPILGRW